MSDAFRNVIDALLIAACAYFIALAYANGRLVDQAIQRELSAPTCVSPNQARELRASCVVIERDHRA